VAIWFLTLTGGTSLCARVKTPKLNAHINTHARRGAPGVQDDVRALLLWSWQLLRDGAPSNDKLLNRLAKQKGRGKQAVEVLREASQVLSRLPSAW